MTARRLPIGLALFLLASLMAAATYTVANTADSGAGSLRQAILDANANPGADTINFNIIGSGFHTIAPLAPLPTITEGVTIDGYSQPGASANTNPPDQGTNAVIEIEIDGENMGSASLRVGLAIAATGVQVRGLAVNRCAGGGIRVTTGGDGAVIAGNFVGPDSTGTSSFPDAQNPGVDVEFAANVVIGGLNPADRNLISGNGSDNVRLGSGSGHALQGNLIGTNAAGTTKLPGAYFTVHGITSAATGVTIGGMTASARNVISGFGSGISAATATIQGNYIGTDVTGTNPIPNATGMLITGPNMVVGGNAAGAGNVIAFCSGGSGTGSGGINVYGASGAVIQGNFIGTDATGTLNLGNKGDGIYLEQSPNGVTIGGVGAGEGNIIAFNGSGNGNGSGIGIQSGTGNRIRGNRIYGNIVNGIDLGFSGPTANDAGDADTGPNNLQNTPIITSVDYGASTTVHATLNSAAATVFDVDFYANPACVGRPTLYPQGQDYVGSTQMTTDGSGIATTAFVLPVALQAGQPVTAVATDPSGNSSEFSQSLVFSTNFRLGAPAGGFTFTTRGQLFETNATLSVGGVPATNVVVTDPTTMTATMPALPAGSVNTIAVSNPSGLSGSLLNGYIVTFNDVGAGYPFQPDITTLVANQITVGVGGGNYGPLDNIKRQSMAVFILKAKHGICYTPPPCTGVFTDVPCSSNFAPWIEAMAAEGITSGCGGGNFCPLDPVRRDQMAVFLLKGQHGSSYVPPICTGVFTDVPCPGQFANWIEQLKTENITGGCGGTNYCPSTDNNRAQMATFIVKTFNLQ
jgi:hypothetical protein